MTRPTLRQRILANDQTFIWWLRTWAAGSVAGVLIYLGSDVSVGWTPLWALLLSPFAWIAGYTLGLVIAWPVFGVLLGRAAASNGAPFVPGDEVLVLTGPFQGTFARVNTLVPGQGGPRYMLDLTNPAGGNTFADHQISRVQRAQTDGS